MINRIISWVQVDLLFAYFLEYTQLFLVDNVMKNVNNFQIAKVKPKCVA